MPKVSFRNWKILRFHKFQSPLFRDFCERDYVNEINKMSRLKQLEHVPIETTNADGDGTEKHQQNASTDRFDNVTNENSKRMIISSGSGVERSFVGQCEELLTNETQSEQPLNLILHKRLHNSTAIQQQPKRQKLLNETETSQEAQVSSEFGISLHALAIMCRRLYKSQ